METILHESCWFHLGGARFTFERIVETENIKVPSSVGSKLEMPKIMFRRSYTNFSHGSRYCCCQVMPWFSQGSIVIHARGRSGCNAFADLLLGDLRNDLKRGHMALLPGSSDLVSLSSEQVVGCEDKSSSASQFSARTILVDTEG